MIVHLFNGNLPHGPERLVLPALARMGMPVSVGILAERRQGETCATADYARSLGLSVFVIEVTRRWDRKALAGLRGKLSELAPKIVHAHDVKASAYLLAVSHRRRYALISTHHGVLGRPGLRAKLYERFYSRFCLPRFERALCVSEADRRLLLARGIPASQLMIHRNGIDRAGVDSADDRLRVSQSARKRWNLDLSPDTKVVGVVARLSGEKRHDLILRAFALASRRRPSRDWRLVCFGTGPLQPGLIALAERLGIASRVHWMGYREQIGEEMAGLDLLVNLSDNEGLPVTLLEAGWGATAVIAPRVGGIPELVSSPMEGVLVEPGDVDGAAAAIEELLEKDSLRRSLGAALHARVVNEFTAEHWLKRLEEVYAPWASP